MPNAWPTLRAPAITPRPFAGKSTAVRALAALLPELTRVEGCPVNAEKPEDVPVWAGLETKKTSLAPTPVVDLPLGVTEDRVTGALDIEKALSQGEKAFQPGLLAKTAPSAVGPVRPQRRSRLPQNGSGTG